MERGRDKTKELSINFHQLSVQPERKYTHASKTTTGAVEGQRARMEIMIPTVERIFNISGINSIGALLGALLMTPYSKDKHGLPAVLF